MGQIFLRTWPMIDSTRTDALISSMNSGAQLGGILYLTRMCHNLVELQLGGIEMTGDHGHEIHVPELRTGSACVETRPVRQGCEPVKLWWGGEGCRVWE